MELLPIELWYNNIFPEITLREIEQLARTDVTMRRFCLAYVTQVDAPLLHRLISRLPADKQSPRFDYLWRVEKEAHPYGAIVCDPKFGVFRTHLLFSPFLIPIYLWREKRARQAASYKGYNLYVFPVLSDALRLVCARLAVSQNRHALPLEEEEEEDDDDEPCETRPSKRPRLDKD